MLRTPFALLAVAAVALAVMPGTQAAFHNATYTAEGFAVSAAGATVAIAAHWHGFCTSSFSVTVSDVSTGAVLEQRRFSGTQQIAPGQQVPFAPELFVVNGQSLDPLVSFHLRGAQVGHINAGVSNQALSGDYQGLVWVGTVVLQPFSFCD